MNLLFSPMTQPSLGARGRHRPPWTGTLTSINLLLACSAPFNFNEPSSSVVSVGAVRVSSRNGIAPETAQAVVDAIKEASSAETKKAAAATKQAELKQKLTEATGTATASMAKRLAAETELAKVEVEDVSFNQGQREAEAAEEAYNEVDAKNAEVETAYANSAGLVSSVTRLSLEAMDPQIQAKAEEVAAEQVKIIFGVVTYKISYFIFKSVEKSKTPKKSSRIFKNDIQFKLIKTKKTLNLGLKFFSKLTIFRA